MKKELNFMLLFLIVLALGSESISAQFPLKIPKIGKPKTEQPKPSEQPQTNPNTPTAPDAGQNRPSPTPTARLVEPEPDDVPRFLPATLEVKAKTESRYWKTPNQDNNPSWYPQVQFDLFYNFGGKITRFTAEYFNPDGSLWFSEGLERYGNGLRSPYESKQIYENGIQTTGTYGVKITDTKTGKVHFQGKFKVAKQPLNPKETPKHLFYVENDWNLPIGYVGFEKNWTDFDVRTRPLAIFWFKGMPEASQFEAELHYNNQRVATTDKGGNINKIAERGEHCFLARDLCAYGLYRFEWENVLIDNSPNARQNSPNGYFLNDKPGEYTIKIFYKGDQVREAKFTVDAKGWIARNAFSEQIFLNDYRVVVPVKIIGNMEKWNQAAWKTDAFYSNPLAGFNVP